MKLSRHVRRFYEELEPRYLSLEPIVSGLIESIIDQRWHYEKRIKKKESFALKIETARYTNPDAVDDFLAGTIVVENAKTIEEAKKRVFQHFKVRSSRPKDVGKTHKHPYAFEFDDLRLYLSLHENSPHYHSFGDLVFELQIKTFLQHAWGIATHDMVYKGDSINWSLSRIAFQVKAMLEHAEASIESADQMVGASCIKKTNKIVEEVNSCADLLNAYWDDEQLPFDVRRLAENILTALKVFNKSIDELDIILAVEASKVAGRLSLNLSPYFFVVQALVNNCSLGRLSKKFSDRNLKIVVTPDIEVPEGVQLRGLRNVVFIESVGL